MTINNLTIVEQSREKVVVTIDAPRSSINSIRRSVMQLVPSMRIEGVVIDRSETNVDTFELPMKLGQLYIDCDPHVFEMEQFESQRGLSDKFRPFPSHQDVSEAKGHGVNGRPGSIEDCTLTNDIKDKRFEQLWNHKTTLVFEIDVECKKEGDQVINDCVYAKHLLWHPMGDQETRLKGVAPRAGGDKKDLPLMNLIPGQRLHCWAFAVRGTPSEHVKWTRGKCWFNKITNSSAYQFYVQSLDGSSAISILMDAIDALSLRFNDLADECCVD